MEYSGDFVVPVELDSMRLDDVIVGVRRAIWRMDLITRKKVSIFHVDAETVCAHLRFSIELDHNALWFTLQKEAFHASLLEMELNGKTEIVLLRDVQYHPFKQLVLHVDFQRVDAKTRLHKKVPLHFINGGTSPAVKLDRSVVNHVMTELEVECLATDLPEHIEIDLGESVKGSTLHVTDLKLPKGIKAVTHAIQNWIKFD